MEELRQQLEEQLQMWQQQDQPGDIVRTLWSLINDGAGCGV